MPRLLFVSKPLGPPWNDSSKNLVRDLALGLTRYDAVAFGRARDAGRLGRAQIEPLHPDTRGGFSPGLRENGRVLARLLTGERCAAWHFFFAPNPKTSGAARAAARLRRARTVQTVCSVPSDGAELSRVLFGDRVVVLSKHTEKRFLDAGIARERLVRIAPAVPPLATPGEAERARFRAAHGISAEAPLLVYPGDLEFGEGARLVLDAHEKLAPNVELALACRPKTPAARAKEAALRERASALGTARRVHFIGETPEILTLVATADMVLLPSTVAYAKMDYPLVLLEAMALARPVLVAENTPAAELAEGGAALAVPATLDAVAEQATRLLANDDARRTLGAAALATARADFSRERMAGAYELLYDGLLS
ncbi:MAG TPA: glycosyltransferase family 4 protein [Polyangiaceae bacterium]|nr:glycosyltransferase family 4 protein [Polyangiaceae bacterium]